MEIDVTEMDGFRIGAVRSDMAHIADAQGQLWAAVGSSDLAGRPRVVGVAVLPAQVVTQGPSPETPYEAAVMVPEDAALPEPLGEGRVPGGRYARAVHVGSYEGLPGAWGAFAGEWLPASGHQVRADGVCFEIYRDSPAEVPEADLRTELYIPLQ